MNLKKDKPHSFLVVFGCKEDSFLGNTYIQILLLPTTLSTVDIIIYDPIQNTNTHTHTNILTAAVKLLLKKICKVLAFCKVVSADANVHYMYFV